MSTWPPGSTRRLLCTGPSVFFIGGTCRGWSVLARGVRRALVRHGSFSCWLTSFTQAAWQGAGHFERQMPLDSTRRGVSQRTTIEADHIRGLTQRGASSQGAMHTDRCTVIAGDPARINSSCSIWEDTPRPHKRVRHVRPHDTAHNHRDMGTRSASLPAQHWAPAIATADLHSDTRSLRPAALSLCLLLMLACTCNRLMLPASRTASAHTHRDRGTRWWAHISR